MGFIGYRRKREADSDEVVRIFLECRDEWEEGRDPAADRGGEWAGISYTYAVEVVFPGGKPPCRLRGVDEILVLKKFYKLIHSLEERAREHGNDHHQALESVEGLLEHLAYTRNARDFTALGEPRRSRPSQDIAAPECHHTSADA